VQCAESSNTERRAQSQRAATLASRTMLTRSAAFLLLGRRIDVAAQRGEAEALRPDSCCCCLRSILRVLIGEGGEGMSLAEERERERVSGLRQHFLLGSVITHRQRCAYMYNGKQNCNVVSEAHAPDSTAHTLTPEQKTLDSSSLS